MQNLVQPPFKKEREKTDESLIVERGKTDDSFEAYNERAEDETDTVVETGRREVDNARMQRRASADVKREMKSTSTDFPSGQSTQSDLSRLSYLQKAGNGHAHRERVLAAERELEDSEIEIERLNMDSALVYERGEKERLMSQLLRQERVETDKSLLGERTRADIEVERSAGKLKNEQTAHSQTKSALTTREEFVAIVSHDLRNPIGTVLSAADVLLEDESLIGADHEARRWIEIIKRNAATSLRLISDILDMERIVDGKIQLQLADVNIATLIKEIIESYSSKAKDKSISLTSEYLESFNLVNCDRDRILQVLSNLVGNAIKFTPAIGTVKVKARETGDDIEISVSDTGPGIPDFEKSRIFEKFAQIGNKERSGIGLGLYISKALVESHHGQLWVTSKTGEGSKFSFTLPK